MTVAGFAHKVHFAHKVGGLPIKFDLKHGNKYLTHQSPKSILR